MNESRKSDSFLVPKKRLNKGPKPAEVAEGRKGTEGNGKQQNMRQTLGWESVHSALLPIHRKAKEDKRARFTTLMHHVYNPATLEAAFYSLKKKAAPGIDGTTWQLYEGEVERNLNSLSERLRAGAYRAKPVKRAYIPKADGRQRPLGITTLEDKVVQRATVVVLNAVYEADFLGFVCHERGR